MSQEIRDKISKMDVKSDEFFEIYKLVSDKYWDKDTIDKDNNTMMAAAMIVKFAERGDEAEIIVTARTVAQLFEMKKNKTGASKMTIGFDDGIEYRVDIYQDGIELGSLEHMIEKGAKALESGNFTVNGKKNQFGKDYFKGKKK